MNPLLKAPLLFWDIATFFTGNYIDALRFYHEAMAEILSLLSV